jgi:hypothetical protein
MRLELNDLIAELTEHSTVYEKYSAWLAELRKDQDALTNAITKLAGGPFGLLTIDQGKTCNKEALQNDPKQMENSTKIACLNLGLAEIQKKMDQTKKDVALWDGKRKECLNQIAVAQKRMIAAGCKDVEPVDLESITSNPPSTQTTSPTTQAPLIGLDVHPFDELLYDLLALADETPNINLFTGKWSGPAKVVKSNQSGAVGTSQTYLLEISKTDDQKIILKSSAGVVGKPELYQTKIDGNHLRVDYAGPYDVPGLPQVDAHLVYALDVTLKNEMLVGYVYVRSDAAYEGKSTDKEFQIDVVLKK